MPQYSVVSREHHAGKKWQRVSSYGFAAKEALVPVLEAEIAKVALSMPLAFSHQDGRYTLMAILSPVPGRNLYVGPQGRWLMSYVPVWFRSYPFRLMPKPGTADLVLCVDTDSGLVVDGGAGGEDFVGSDANLSPALKTVLDFLTAAERSRKSTDLAVAALAEVQLIQPWPIKLKSEQGEQAVRGLHRIDEARLRALPDEAFLKLRKSSALPIAYTQLLSMGHLSGFEALAKLQAQLTPPPAAALPESLDRMFSLPTDDDIIRFR